MTNFTDIKTRVRQMLDDADARRFSDALIQSALRQALDEINLQLPHSKIRDVSISTSSRDQSLSGMEDCLFITGILWQQVNGSSRELEPETQFTYTLKSGVPSLHFSGAHYPQAGDVLHVNYAAGYTLTGFESQTVTTLPFASESALVTGTSAQACILRSGSLLEAHGTRAGDSERLRETGQAWLKTFDRALKGLKVMQEFGFPPGFTLDQWDKGRR